jgi:putative transposase
MCVLRRARRCRSIALHPAGKPTQNAFIERFNVRQRDELLNEMLFTSLAQVRTLLAAWKNDYNDARPRKRLAISRRPNMPIAVLSKRNGTRRCAMPAAPRLQLAQMPPGLSTLLDELRG